MSPRVLHLASLGILPAPWNPVEKVADLLRHEDTWTTIRYLGINEDDKLAAMRLIDEVFG